MRASWLFCLAHRRVMVVADSHLTHPERPFAGPPSAMRNANAFLKAGKTLALQGNQLRSTPALGNDTIPSHRREASASRHVSLTLHYTPNRWRVLIVTLLPHRPQLQLYGWASGPVPPAQPRGVPIRSQLREIAEVWRRGSVIASWLLDLTAAAPTARRDTPLSNAGPRGAGHDADKADAAAHADDAERFAGCARAANLDDTIVMPHS